MKNKHRLSGLLWWLIALMPLSLMADETEIYTTAQGNPNVLFLLDLSGSMRQTINDGDAATTDKTRVETLKSAFSSVMSSAPDNINVGLMHYANHGLGNDYWWSSIKGVNFPILPINSDMQTLIAPHQAGDNLPNPTGTTTTVRQFLSQVVSSWGGAGSYVEGYTPIVDSLYEAARYFKGDAVGWGRDLPALGWAAHPLTYGSGVTCAAGKSVTSTCVKTWGECNATATACTTKSFPRCCNWIVTGGDGSGVCENNNYTCSSDIEECTHSVCTEFSGTPNYLSPIKNKCQKNYLVLMSDGKPEYPYYPGAPEVDGTHYYPPSSARYPGNTGGATTGYAADKTADMTKRFSQKLENYMGKADDYCTPGVTTGATGINYNSGTCGPELTEWLATNDMSPALGTDKKEVVKTFTIGFAMADEPKGMKFLDLLATKGQGKFFQADNETQLVASFNDIFKEVIQAVSFTSPTYSINQDTLLSHSNDVYIPVSAPSSDASWEGNLKKFTRDATGKIVNEDGTTPAFTDKGEPTDSTNDLWGASGKEVSTGGAASQLPAPAARKLYTDVSNDLSLIAASNALASTNNLITDSLLTGVTASTTDASQLFDGTASELSTLLAKYPSLSTWAGSLDLTKLGTPHDGISCFGSYKDCTGKSKFVFSLDGTKCVNIAAVTTCNTANSALPTGEREALLNFARGDADPSPSVTTPRQHMGDMLNTKPLIVNYGDDGQRIFAATNEGFLHSIDTDTGVEQWAFMPKGLLPNIQKFMENLPSSEHVYGIDGPLTLWENDVNKDGTIKTEDGDKRILFFGLRRGGKAYYALDITLPDAPKILWRKENTAVVDDVAWHELGETWSKLTLAKMRIGSATSSAIRDVVVFGAGYDVAKDNEIPNDPLNVSSRPADALGSDVMIVDALTGELLWSLQRDLYNDSASANPIKDSIPGDIRVMDMDRNGALDRLYFTDTGGNVWRVDMDHDLRDTDADMYNYDDAVLTKIAALGTDSTSGTDVRKFFYEPDVALIQYNGKTHLTIALGSGYRTHPLNTNTEDRFYVLVDPNVYNEPPKTDDAVTGKKAFATITNADLTNARGAYEPSKGSFSDANDSLLKETHKGWYYDFSITGEKVLAPAVSALNKVVFTTFAPVDETGVATTTSADSCDPIKSSARAYVLNLFTGKAVADLDGNASNGNAGQDDFVVSGVNEILNAAQVVFRAPKAAAGGECTEGDCKQTVELRVGKMSIPLMASNNASGTGLGNNPDINAVAGSVDMTDIMPRMFWRDHNVTD